MTASSSSTPSAGTKPTTAEPCDTAVTARRIGSKATGPGNIPPSRKSAQCANFVAPDPSGYPLAETPPLHEAGFFNCLQKREMAQVLLIWLIASGFQSQRNDAA